MNTIDVSAWIWWHSVGYTFAIVVPSVPLYWISRLLWRQIALLRGVPTNVADDPRNQNRDLPALVGVIERVLYVAAILTGAKELVGVWLALKVAGSWELWKEGTTVEWFERDGRHLAEIGGRSFFQTFLVAAALSLLNAAAAAGAVDLALRKHPQFATYQLVAVTALTLAIWLFVYFRWRTTQAERVPPN